MDILVCGTAAAEGWPAVFCRCEACRAARELGGRNVRSRAAYHVNQTVRVDFGPDSNLHMQKYGLDYSLLTHLLVTHSHEDHWYPRELSNRRKGFSKVPETPLPIWGNAKVEAKFEAFREASWEDLNLRFHRLKPWTPIPLAGDLSATPVLAAHDRSEECVNYLFEERGRSALLGHDTGWYDEPTWEFLSQRPLNVALIDCTYGSLDSQNAHLGCEAVIRARDELARRGALVPDARVVATHFSHNGAWLHEDLDRFFQPHGIQVAYDGMTLTA